MSALDQFLSYIGQIVLYGGGSSGVAFLIFRYLGKGWIDARFAERLESFKHEQAKELQRLKVEVESILSGALKIQEREFTVLPEAWQKLNDAHALTEGLLSPLQTFADLDRMTGDEQEEFLALSELRESQKSRIRAAAHKNQVYQDSIFWHRLTRAKDAVFELQKYTVSHGLFLPPPLKQQFAELSSVLWFCLTTYEVGQEHRDHGMKAEARTHLQDNAGPLHSQVELAIEQRIHSHGRSNFKE